MPKIEVEETEFLANKNLAATVAAMLGNPKSRALVFEAQKIVKPDAVIPEVDAKTEVMAELAKEREARLKLEKQIADDKEKAEAEKKSNAFKESWDRQKQALRAEGLLDESIEKIEKHAEAEGIPNLRAAAADYLRLNPPKETVGQPSGFGSFNFFEPVADEGEDMKKLLETRGESEPVLSGMVRKALDEVRGTPQRRAA